MATLSEFSLIAEYFSNLTPPRFDVELGIGDDCALLCPDGGKLVAISIDTLVEGVHFFPDVDPESLGYKSLAVSLSDLAAMGAEPAWFTLALTLPSIDSEWLKAFSSGLATLATEHNIQLIGGDTTSGPLSISIQVHGFVDRGSALRRDAAKEGDFIFVSGTLGDAGAALKHRLENWCPESFDENDIDYLQTRLEKPTPQLAIAALIRTYTHAAIDVSDGLLADLGHILNKSQVGAEIDLDKLPLSLTLAKLEPQLAYSLALSSGDDYELCFTVPAENVAEIERLQLDIQCVGRITNTKELVLKEHGSVTTFQIEKTGYDHFRK